MTPPKPEPARAAEENGTPTTAVIDCDAGVSDAGSTVMVKVVETDRASSASVAVTTYGVAADGTVGVPASSPVAPSMSSPAGRSAAAKVIAPTPVDVKTVGTTGVLTMYTAVASPGVMGDGAACAWRAAAASTRASDRRAMPTMARGRVARCERGTSMSPPLRSVIGCEFPRQWPCQQSRVAAGQALPSRGRKLL